MAGSRVARIVAAAELDRVSAALGTTPPVTLAAAHVYPAAAPAYERAPRAERERPGIGPLRLYVHIPFCNYKCNFCHFATRVGDTRKQQERYTAALERELEWVEFGTRLSQLFVGGGTPTALPFDLLDRLLATLFERMPPVEGQVHTVEASPESVTEAHVRVLRERGVGRISMGVQTLDERVLEGVHRRHSSEQVFEACELLLRGGLIVNVDLMYGLPGQTRDSFRRDVETIAGRGVHSLTLYDLRIKSSTPLGRSLKEKERLDLARLLRWRRFLKTLTADLGFTQTRWHTFKRLDTIAARHERAPCFDADMRGYQLGIGMSARSHMGQTIYRNHDRMGEYMRRVEADASPVEQIFRLGDADLRTQLIARTLGDGKPLTRSAYAHTFGRPIERDYGEILERLIGGGLIVDQDGSLSMSELGRLVYDRVMLNFYPKHALDWLWARAV